MDLMANPVITDFQQDVNGDIKMLKLGVKKEDAYANIIGQAESAKLDNNKTATINVSTYTVPVEILPTSGKDGMKKATVTLSNIPSGAGSPMELGFKGWKGKQSASAGAEDIYVGFLADGEWITDKTLVTDIDNVDMIIVFNATADLNPGIRVHIWYNMNKYNGFPENIYSFPNLPYTYVECQAIYDNTTDNLLNIASSASSQHSDLIYGWATAQFVESLPMMVYTPEP